MRKLILLIALLATVGCSSHAVSFTTILKKENATKDGIYLDNYVVNLSYDSILALHNKKIRVTGRYRTIEAVQQNDPTGIRQGRDVEFKYINKPKIEIVESF